MKTRYDEMLEAANEFHAAHPEVWAWFCHFTFEKINEGFKHYSAQHGVFARIRWETDKAIVDENTFKINNNHSPFYARGFMMTYPEHDGFFRLRVMTSTEEPATGLPELTPEDFD
jgi:hypothetical protein